MKKQMEEALKRMKLLKMSKQCIEAFKNNKVWESEGYGALYEVNEDEQQIINEFETNHKEYLVYHMIHDIFEFGEVYTLLYISPYEEEWEQDISDLKDGYHIAYCYNKTYPECSEFGSVAIKSNIGGLVRVG